MKRTETRLADGRALIYFDEREDMVRDAVDRRDLDKAKTSSEMRFDPLREDWVVVASHRQGRTHPPPTEECPLCPSRPGHLTEIPASDYDVAVFENRFPAFAMDVADVGDVPGDHDLVPRRAGIGRCEVVCFTSAHLASFASLSPARVRMIVDVWADRTAELSQLAGVEQVFAFENRGEEIGVTLHHPHGQIYAYPFVTPRTRQMLGAAHRLASEPAATCSPICWRRSNRRPFALCAAPSTGPPSCRRLRAGRSKFISTRIAKSPTFPH